ncbi:MAG: DoxX family protein [Candidatus Acidiferrales bacterium]
MSNSSGSVIMLMGRVLLCSIFLISGVTKIGSFSSLIPYLDAKGLPFPAIALGGAMAVEIFGGLAILAGFRARIAAWLLFLFVIVSSLIFHSFWAMQGVQREVSTIMFLKNLAIMGGLLILAANGAGGYSLDARRSASA